MSETWTVLFFRDERGREPVREWLEELDQRHPKDYATVRHSLSLLGEFGVHLSEPHSKQLAGRLRELRPGPWRITYFADPKRRMILLTSFRKKGQRTDVREIERAKRLMADWQRRTERGET